MSCPQCFQGSIRIGKPTGRVEEVYGLCTYIADPPTQPAKGIVVMIPDAFGWDFINNRILADNYAKKGNFQVYLPDFMDGHSAPVYTIPLLNQLSSNTGLWGTLVTVFTILPRIIPMFAKFMYCNRLVKVVPRRDGFFTQLRASTNLPIGVAGFCWGAIHTFGLSFLPKDEQLVDVAYCAHPSAVKVEEWVRGMNVPMSIAIGTEDLMGMKAMKKMQGLMKRREVEVENEFVFYEGAKHGFAVRMDIDDEKEKRQSIEAEDQLVNWFNRFFEAKK